ncbi:ABC transporter substrate-binding protein [Xanthobacter dioxanivorans]|uniref:ABC transporter substrate-binding protein n=1 Tax=Xanthobacter dioxanivorans TaxID=2528964 RepID=A0A974PPC7_9HYPH|nr:ABC transporter substrate-binding protein [Xanthobacter dioxanivorans]QRG07304.1 ABC transporter substrate-binding protein [Xanthobacter dioxanivorans]
MPQDSFTPSRRSLLKAGGALALCATAGLRLPTPAIAQTRAIKLTLPWLANGSTLFTYVAKNQGFFKKRGLEVTISRGFGSVAAAQTVGAGEFDFGFVFAGGIILGAARGLPLVAMGTLGYDATMGILVRADSPIKTAKDLEGKKIGIVPTSAEAPYWPAFARKAGIDTSGISMVQMDNRVLEQSLINNQVDAITAIGTSSVPVMMALKQPSRFMLWSKAGVSLYAGQVVTRAETLAKDKALCQAVTDALVEGLVFALKDPEAGVDIFLKEVPEVGVTKGGKENATISQGLMHYTVLSPEAEQRAIGFTDMTKVAGMVDLVMEYGAPKDAKRPDPATLFTNDFVGDVGKLTPDQWAKVKANVAEYAAILG